MDPKFEKKLDENDIDMLIRMRNSCNLNTKEMKQKVIKLKQTLFSFEVKRKFGHKWINEIDIHFLSKQTKKYAENEMK
jgi:hypothetical protein